MTMLRTVIDCVARPAALVLAASVLASSALGAGGGGGGGGSPGDGDAGNRSPEYVQAQAALQAERWSEAIVLLERHVRQHRNDADGFNGLAYAYRKTGRLDEAFTHYRRALTIDPTHRGAHEYIGEAYLMAGQPEKAEFHLRELARLCASSCEEFRDLDEAIAKHRVARTSSGKAP